MIVEATADRPPRHLSFSPLGELREEIIVPALVVPFACSFLLIGIYPAFADPLLGLLTYALLFGLPIAASALLRISYASAAWLLVIGCVVGNLLVVAGTGIAALVGLLPLFVTLAVLLLGLRAAAAVALLCSALLYAPLQLPLVPELRGVTLLALAGSWMLMLLLFRPLAQALEAGRAAHERGQELLEQARDYQLQLNQTVADLADANLQMARLNQLGQSLRMAAEAAWHAKQEFVANVSHELRTPLNMVVGFSEMIVRSPDTYGSRLPPALLADLDVILRNAQHLSALIDDVLDLSQIEAGQMALTREHVRLDETLRAASGSVRPLFTSKCLTLDLDVPDGLVAFCDRTRIREVILNLLSNAARFTERGGVRLSARAEQGEITVSVTDTGRGITAEDQEKLFRPFQQLDGSIRRRYGGSGLGLAISKNFVELHGGSLWVESQVGRGTTFSFRLPAEHLESPISGAASRIDPDWVFRERTRRSAAPRATIFPRLIALEDGTALQHLLARYLEGYEVVPARTLEEAVGELGKAPAAAMLVNAQSVADNLHRVLETVALPYGTPAIICTLPEAGEAASLLGAAGYLVKPISRTALLAALDGLQLRKRTVLIIDDEPEAIRLFRRMLTSEGANYQVLGASNGREAMELLARRRPGAILVDLVMPEMDGFQLLAARAADPALRAIPAIVISARDPAGQPIVSPALAVTRGGGISVGQLLACIESLTRILSPLAQPERPASAETSPG